MATDMQRATRTVTVTPNTAHRNRNTRPPAENTAATMAAAAMLMTPSTTNATTSREGGTGPTAAIGSNHRRQQPIANIATTVAATTAGIILRSCVLKYPEAIIESIVIRHSETSARDPAGNRLDTAPAATYAVLKAA